MVTAVEKPKLTRADRLYRSLQLAKEQGIELFTDPDTGQWFATSGSVAGILYRVDDRGCNCAAWAHVRSGDVRSCKHYAAYLERRGKRPPTVAELEDALNVAADYEERARGGFLKTTADWRAQLTARYRAERLLDLACAENVAALPPVADAGDLPPAA